jgi:predicted anti-sigma-YlaC factor YlaD
VSEFATHDHYRESLAELSLGILDGRERVTVLEHVSECEECTAELASLARTVDALGTIVPSREPGLGFETRVLDEVARSRRAARPTARWALAAAAAVVALVVGLVIGDTVFSGSPPNRAAAFERPLVGRHGVVGQVVAFTSGYDGPWMMVSLAGAGSSPTVWCDVVTTSGRRVDLGAFDLADGAASWRADLPVSINHVRQVLISGPGGATLADLGRGPWQVVG